jgi:hypothetical protein
LRHWGKPPLAGFIIRDKFPVVKEKFSESETKGLGNVLLSGYAGMLSVHTGTGEQAGPGREFPLPTPC